MLQESSKTVALPNSSWRIQPTARLHARSNKKGTATLFPLIAAWGEVKWEDWKPGGIGPELARYVRPAHMRAHSVIRVFCLAATARVWRSSSAPGWILAHIGHTNAFGR